MDEYAVPAESARHHHPSPFESDLFKSNLESLRQLCDSLNLCEDLKKKACDVLHDVSGADLLNTDTMIPETELFVCILYMAVIKARMPYGPTDPNIDLEERNSPSISISSLLTEMDVNVMTLFNVLKTLQGRTELPDTVHHHLKLMKQKYCIFSAMFHKFDKRVCAVVFKEDNSVDDMENILPPLPITEGVNFRKKLCWVVFLLAKYNLIPDSDELTEHFHLLLCSLELVLRYTPSFLLKPPYDAIRFGYASEGEQQSMLDRLAEDFTVSQDEIETFQIEIAEPFFQELLSSDELLEYDSLCEKYRQIYKQNGDLNELLFLAQTPHLMPLHSKRSEQNNHNTKTLKDIPPLTPVKAVLGAVQRLQLTLSNVTHEPSDALQEQFKKCTDHPWELILRVVADLKGRFLSEYKALNTDCSRRQRFSLGHRLYLKTLENILKSESGCLSQSVLNNLLNKEKFHKSLLACSMEVVLLIHRQNWSDSTHMKSDYAFPWILQLFSLQSYDFYLVIDTFIKSSPDLQSEIHKHLKDVEVQILENLAWKEGSSLFDSLAQWEGRRTTPVASPIKSPGVSSHGFSSSTARDLASLLSPQPGLLFVSPSSSAPSTPVKMANGTGEVAEASNWPASSSQRSVTQLKSFMDKVSQLAYKRLTDICGRLEISDHERKIWTCFDHCVNKKPLLLMNRHIDQIIMCSIYGICKVLNKEIKFSSIVSMYRELDYTHEAVFKNVVIAGDNVDTIVTFYNRIFMQNMKSFLWQFAPNSDSNPQLSPKPMQPHGSPSYSLPGKKNFIISPMKKSPFKTPHSPSKMTPVTSLLYDFKDSIGHSSQQLRDINEIMSARKPKEMSARKRLNLDDKDMMRSPKVQKVLS